jgi:hypothetical protein
MTAPSGPTLDVALVNQVMDAIRAASRGRWLGPTAAHDYATAAVSALAAADADLLAQAHAAGAAEGAAAERERIAQAIWEYRESGPHRGRDDGFSISRGLEQAAFIADEATADRLRDETAIADARTAPGAHSHHCPDCGHDWDCDPPQPMPCHNQIANGRPDRICDLCWGMRKPARISGHDKGRQ